MSNNKVKERWLEFLLSFFPKEDKYMVVEVNGYTLVKQKNSNSWGVAVWKPNTYQKTQEIYKKSFKEEKKLSVDKDGATHHHF